MRTKENKKGISLIVVIVTIIVVIILAAVVILTLSKNNPIESAKEARFKEDVRTFQDELALAVSKEYADAGGHRDTKISASDFEEIKRYIPSFSEKYRDKFVIQDDELRYTRNLDENEKIFTQSLNIKEKVKLLPDEYQQVEYIESTGSQYIDSMINVTDIFSFECKWLSTKNNNYGLNGAFYWKSSEGQKAFCFGRNRQGKLYMGIGTITDVNNNSTVNTTYTTIGNKYNMETKNDSEIYRVTGEFRDVNLNFYLFATDEEQGVRRPNYFATEEIFYCKLYNENNIIRNFVPCYSTITVTDVNGKQCPSGTKGLYDTVEGKFYTNQGTGEFIAGPDVD